MRASQLDLDYGRLQFGEQPVAEHAATLATARGELDRAFAIQQELDLVETPDTPLEDRAVREKLAEQLELLHAADTRLDAAAPTSPPCATCRTPRPRCSPGSPAG